MKERIRIEKVTETNILFIVSDFTIVAIEIVLCVKFPEDKLVKGSSFFPTRRVDRAVARSWAEQ